MKKRVNTFLAGFLLATLLFGGGLAIAASVTAIQSTATVYVDGTLVEVEAYSIAGSNYFKLRDFCSAVDIGVWYEESTRSVFIETYHSYDPDQTEAIYNNPIQLGAGQYIVGTDLQAGVYDLLAIAGLGNIIGEVESLGYLGIGQTMGAEEQAFHMLQKHTATLD